MNNKTSAFIAFLASLSMSSCGPDEKVVSETCEPQECKCSQEIPEATKSEIESAIPDLFEEKEIEEILEDSDQAGNSIFDPIIDKVNSIIDSTEEMGPKKVVNVFNGKEIVYVRDLSMLENAIKTYSYLLGDKNKLVPEFQQVANYINPYNFQIIGIDHNGVLNGDFHTRNHHQNREIIGNDHPELINHDLELPFVSTNRKKIEDRPGINKSKKRAIEIVNFDGENIKRMDLTFETFNKVFKTTDTYKRLDREDPALAQAFAELVVFGLVPLESGYDQNASSGVAHGLFQIKENVAQGLLKNAQSKGFLTDLKKINIHHLNTIRCSATLAPFHFDATYKWLVDNLGPSHDYFKLDQKVQLLMLLQAYNNGQGRAVQIIKYFFEKFPNEFRDGFEYFNSNIPSEFFDKNGKLKPDFHFFMITEYFKGRNAGEKNTTKRYGSDSHQYLAKILAYHYLFTGESIFLDSSSDTRQLSAISANTIDNVDISNLDPVFQNALKNGFSPKIISSNERPLSNISINVPAEVRQYLLHSPNSPNNQGKVFDWFESNDAFKNIFESARENHGSVSRQMVEELVENGHLINLDKNPIFSFAVRSRDNITPGSFTIKVDGGDSGIGDTWRRNIRVDHKEIIDELATRINEKLYEAGMSRDYFIAPIINSALRVNSVRGSSMTSLHLWNSALDIMIGGYAVHRKNSDGSISTFPVLEENRNYLNAIRLVLFEMGKEGKLFPREETSSPHFHFVPKANQNSNNSQSNVGSIPNTRRIEDKKTKDYVWKKVPPKVLLKKWIPKLTNGKCTSADIRKYNGKGKYNKKDRKTQIRPGDSIKIPNKCLED
ncbi:MAG: hypothetical protein RBS56_00480 [Candidatus Gracilibacteria bacterium]|jgi:hypothetical protein|nr:hypothetical protein [Candidatus Gracilibacteria bacterium]